MKQELVKIEQEIVPIQKCRLTTTSLQVPRGTSIEEWIKIGGVLKSFHKSNKWWIGDWLNFGEKEYGEMFSQAMDETELDYQTLQKYKWVSGSIELSLRRNNLSFSHHELVGKMNPNDQDNWLNKAEKEKWDVRSMKEEIREAEKLPTPELPKGKYNVLLIDPPWQYKNTGVEGAVSREYPTMSIEELSEIPIKEITTENAVMFLWITNPILEEGFELIKNWGFSYKTNMVYIKKGGAPGIGFYVRGCHELLLICIKGSFLPLTKEYVSSVIETNRLPHSQKPEIVYEIIEKLYPNQKYLELFARNNKKRKNWTYWGQEANL